MPTEHIRGAERSRESFPRVLLTCLWAASVVILLLEDRGTAFIALGFGAFMLVLWLVTRRLVPEPQAGRDVLKAAGSRALLAARTLVVAAGVIVVFIHSFAGSKLILMPRFESAYRAVARLAPSLGSGLPNFVLYALIPGLLVAALGARRRELGLTRPARGTYLATVSVVGLFLLSWVWRMTHGGPSIPMLGLFLAHNFLSNGFSEEFQTRGLVLSHMRAFVSTEWALLIQAMVFALLHFGGSLHDEPSLIGVLANVIALNLPMGYFLGRAALRTGSLFLPTVVHVVLDSTRNVWM